MATARIKKEIAQCQAPDSPVKVEMVGDSLMTLRGKFKGPEGTPYEGGIFVVDIQGWWSISYDQMWKTSWLNLYSTAVSMEYPFKPPKVGRIASYY
jgi:ubiquitin-protein ligase